MKLWTIGQKLGGGACANVFEATPSAPIKNSPASGYVIKVAPVPSKPKTQKGKELMRAANSLYAEYMVYGKLFKCKGIPFLPLNAYGEANGYRYIVMERLGRTLGDIVNQEGPIPQHTAARIGYELVQSIEEIHAKNIVYVDIKPDNFIVSKGIEDSIYCVDFGICDTYISAVKRSHKPQVFGTLVGTPAFLSTDCHHGSNASRKDDMEALCYVLIYAMKGNLPWMKATSDKAGADLKKNTAPKELCHGFDPVWASILQEVKDCPFEQAPNYAKIKTQLKSMIKKATGPFAWK